MYPLQSNHACLATTQLSHALDCARYRNVRRTPSPIYLLRNRESYKRVVFTEPNHSPSSCVLLEVSILVWFWDGSQFSSIEEIAAPLGAEIRPNPSPCKTLDPRAHTRPLYIRAKPADGSRLRRYTFANISSPRTVAVCNCIRCMRAVYFSARLLLSTSIHILTSPGTGAFLSVSTGLHRRIVSAFVTRWLRCQ
ncbi:hypothetical protein F5141DRAFT_1147045 [Pisolithus sp. B1]|nr:hypothetical protein F5141DRAFT_1147045 [Pisolithus sp. B1]